MPLLSLFHRPTGANRTMHHRPAIASPSSSPLTPYLTNLRIPNTFILEASHLIQMLDLLTTRLTAAQTPTTIQTPSNAQTPTPTNALTPTPSTIGSHRSLSMRSLSAALERISHRRPSHPQQAPHNAFETAIYQDIATIFTYSISQIDTSRCPGFLARIVAARDSLLEFGAVEIVAAVDRAVERMREWVRVDGVAGRGAGAVVFGGR